jgi:hypothetical protein
MPHSGHRLIDQALVTFDAKRHPGKMAMNARVTSILQQPVREHSSPELGRVVHHELIR